MFLFKDILNISNMCKVKNSQCTLWNKTKTEFLPSLSASLVLELKALSVSSYLYIPAKNSKIDKFDTLKPACIA